MPVPAKMFEDLLLKELPEDVWLELSMTASDISKRFFLKNIVPAYGILVGYLKVCQVQEPYSAVSFNGENYIAIRFWNMTYNGFVLDGKTSDWFDIDLNFFEPSEIEHSSVLKDLYNNPYYSYGGRIFA